MEQAMDITHLQAQLKELQEVAQLAYWEYDLKTRAFILNDEIFSLLHTTAEKEGGYIFPGENYISRFIHPDDWQRTQEQFTAALTSKDPGFLTQGEYRFICADREVRYFFVQFKVQADEQGKTIRLFGAAQDVTARRQNEQELLQFKLGIERSDAAVFLTDADGVIRYVNPAFTQVYGYTAAEALGKTPRIIKSGKVPDERYEEFWHTLLGHQVVSGEIINKAKDGRLLNIEGSNNPIVDNEGNLIGFLAMHRDVTAKRQTEDALLSSEQIVEEILEKQRKLHTIGLQLARADSLDALYREAIELGRSELGFERLGLFILDEATQTMHGTYGIGPDGRVRTENDNVVFLAEAPSFRDFLYNQERLIINQNAELFERDESIGQGWHMTAAMWTANHPIGLLFSDSYLSQKPLQSYQPELLSAYATTIANVVFNKRNELAIRVNEGRLAEATDIAKLHYWEFDVATQMFTFLPEYYELLGTSGEEEGGYAMSAADYAQKYVPAYESPIVEKEVVAALLTTDPNYRREMDSVNITKDGRIIPIRVRFRIVKDSEGNTIRIIGANQDITERVKVEQELRERESLLRTLLNSIPDLIFYKDVDGLYLGCNEAFAEFAGLAEADLVGKTDFDMFPQDVAAFFREQDVAMMEQGQSRSNEEWVTYPDGRHVLLDTLKTPFYDENGNLLGLIGISRDMTLSRQAQERISRQAQQLQSVTEVATAISTILEQSALLQTIVDMTKERFNLYHAHIYLLEPSGNLLILAAGAGEVGQALTAEGHRIPLTQEQSLVARAARSKQSVIINDVQADPGFLPNPLLPDTRSEMAVPIISGDELIGVLDIQADQADYFSQEDANIQTTLAAQIATAVENSRLLQETQEAVEELNAVMRRLTRESWEEYLQSFEEREQGFAYDYGQLLPLDKSDSPDLSAATADPQNGRNGLLAHPLTVHGEAIGRLALIRSEEEDEAEQTAVDAQEVEAIIAAVAEQLSARIENIRLTEQTQAALSLTERLYQAGDRINSAGNNLQEALAAVNEAGAIPEVNRAVLFLFEWDNAGEQRAIVATANWYKGWGAKPTAVGTRYEREAMAALGLMLTQNVLTFTDAIHDERIDDVTKGVFKALNIQSLVVLPLWVGSRQLGSVLLEAEEVHQFTEREIEPYTALSGQLAIAVDRQRLLQEAQTRAERERQIRTITDKIHRGVDREAILQIARDEISQLLRARKAAGQLGTTSLILERLKDDSLDQKQ